MSNAPFKREPMLRGQLDVGEGVQCLEHGLQGADEAAAFTEGQYLRQHQSTLRKVNVIAEILLRLGEGTLKTAQGWRDRHGTTVMGVAMVLEETTIWRLAALFCVPITVGGAIVVGLGSLL